MKFSLFILTIFLFTVSYWQRNTGFSLAKADTDKTNDTIIERNNPKSLDMSIHQLFIDTTRTYIFYERVEKANLIQNPQQEYINYINQMFENQIFEKFDLEEFPRFWLTLRKYKGEFFLYDRCDGSDYAYGLTDSTFNIYDPHELDIRMITKLIKISKSEIEIEAAYDKKNNQEKPLKLTIKKTEQKDVYALNFEGYYTGKSYITPFKNVRNFDLIVNHCPKYKINEVDDKFDK